MNSIKLLLILFFSFQAMSEVKDPVYDELEGLPLIDSLIRDGRLSQAETELKSINERTDAYHHSVGHLHMARENWAAARDSYRRATPTDRRDLWLARSYERLEAFNECVSAFENSGALWLNSEADSIRKAACEFKAGRIRAAWSTLTQAFDRYRSFSLQRERVSLALECGLSQEALELALGDNLLTSGEWLALAELFHLKKLDQEALILLEWARLRAPFDVDVNLSLAQVYFAKGMKLATVEAFHRASLTQPKYHYHLAEFHRQAGRHVQAQYHNILIPEKNEKFKAQLAQLIDRQHYPLIGAMEPLVLRSDLNRDDEVRYAMAYALSRQGEAGRSLFYLSRIQRPELLEKTAHLKRRILESLPATADKTL